jgi:hypothetical protein
MEPSSTSFRRAGTLLTMIALVWLGGSGSATARGFVGMGRVQAIRVVPGIPARPQPVHRQIVPRPVVSMPNNSFLQHRLHRHRLFGGAAFGFSGPYGYASPYPIETGEPDLAAYGPVESADLPFERAACVRPLIIHIKPVERAVHLPRVIYGRPPIC